MKITIDNKIVEVLPGSTVLTAAKDNDVYIPSLCYHPELTPYGGCRLCLVEIEGQRGYPTACTTEVQDGMVVRTQSKRLQEMRLEMMQLILSEHPGSCLICDERNDCNEYMTTIRKVSMTTGCRWCPKDRDCELQQVVEYLGIDEITFPVYYRSLEPETCDPFYDRDYNLCIYCGRCVRICEEHRKSSVIALNQRGRLTTISPAFGTSHIEGDCEFCGACITVCPTGALSEKKRKWDGVPDTYQPAFCAFCGTHCELQLALSGNRLIGTLPPGDPHASGGDLCVKGRFMLAELLNHCDRLTTPYFRFEEGEGIVTLETAVEKTKEAIKKHQKDKTAVFISPDLRTEDMLAIESFAKSAFKNVLITSSVLTKPLIEFSNLAAKSVNPEQIKLADCIISLFVNGNYGYAPTTIAVKTAAEHGVPFYQIGFIRDTTSRFATSQFFLTPDKAVDFLQNLTNALSAKTGYLQLDEMAKKVSKAKNPLIVLGDSICDFSNATDIIETVEKLQNKLKANLHLTLPRGNLGGLLSLPGLVIRAEVDKLISLGKIKSFWIFGDAPFHKTPDVDFHFLMAGFKPPEESNWNLLMPMSLWGEQDGTVREPNGKVLTYKSHVQTPEGTLSPAQFIRKLAKSIGSDTTVYSEKKLTQNVNKLTLRSYSENQALKPAELKPPGKKQLWLIQQYYHHAFNDFDLADKIEGLHDLLPSKTLVMHPADADLLGLNQGEMVEIWSPESRYKAGLIVRRMPLQGVCLINLHPLESPFPSNPVAVTIRRSDV